MSRLFDGWTDPKDLKSPYKGKSILYRHPSNRPYRIQYFPSLRKFHWKVSNIWTGRVLREGWTNSRMSARLLVRPLLVELKEEISRKELQDV